MLKPLLLSGLLSVSVFSAWAQSPGSTLASETYKQRLRAQYLQNDTAQALINLYGRRQAGGATWILSATLAALRMATAGGRTVTTGSGMTIQEEGPNPAVAFLVATPIMAYGVGKMVHYSNGKLDQLLTSYAAGQPLPHNVRRKLKPRFFDQSIIPYTPVKAASTK